MDDEVPAENRKTAIGALVAGVDRAVGILDGVLDDQLLLGAEAERLGGGRDGCAVLALRNGIRRRGAGGEQSAGEDDGAGPEGETARPAASGGKREHVVASPENHGGVDGIAARRCKVVALLSREALSPPHTCHAA
ncbi:hypothetical protein [Streptomyces syringium]|uniref:hypothetical protein n=1 Tax=Streptomyces syringium TaxID=76729 RepID=UPI003F5589CB